MVQQRGPEARFRGNRTRAKRPRAPGRSALHLRPGSGRARAGLSRCSAGVGKARSGGPGSLAVSAALLSREGMKWAGLLREGLCEASLQDLGWGGDLGVPPLGFCEAGSLLDHPNPLCFPTFDFSLRPSGLRRREPGPVRTGGPSVRVGEVEGLEVQGAEGAAIPGAGSEAQPSLVGGVGGCRPSSRAWVC